MKFLKEEKNGISISLRVIPNSAQDRVIGYTDDFLKIKITAPPNENKANKHIIEYLSDIFGVPKSKISFISGEKSKLKRLLIVGISLEALNAKILCYDKINL